MRWLHSITDSMDMSLSQLWEMVKDRKAQHQGLFRASGVCYQKILGASFYKILLAEYIQSMLGKQMGKQCQTLFFWAPKSLQMVTAAMKLKDGYSLEGKL